VLVVFIKLPRYVLNCPSGSSTIAGRQAVSSNISMALSSFSRIIFQ